MRSLERTVVEAAKIEAARVPGEAGDDRRNDEKRRDKAGLRCTMCGCELNGWFRDDFLGRSLIKRRWPKRGPPRKR